MRQAEVHKMKKSVYVVVGQMGRLGKKRFSKLRSKKLNRVQERLSKVCLLAQVFMILSCFWVYWFAAATLFEIVMSPHSLSCLHPCDLKMA